MNPSNPEVFKGVGKPVPVPVGRINIPIPLPPPTFDWGYFCGLMIGDGTLWGEKGKGAVVGLQTSDHELIDIFKRSISCISPRLKVTIHKKEYPRRFPNGKWCYKPYFGLQVSSKALYLHLRPYKLPDHHWKIPTFLTTDESLRGFLSGIFDAEGSIGSGQIIFTNKHEGECYAIKLLLARFGIESRVFKSKDAHRLRICGRKNLKPFLDLIGFRLTRKLEKLKDMLIDRTNHYKPEEDEILKSKFLTTCSRELSKMLGRDVKSIYRRAKILRLISGRKPKCHRRCPN